MVVLHFVAFKGQSPFQCRAVDVCQLPGSALSPDLYEQFVNEPVWLQQLCETQISHSFCPFSNDAFLLSLNISSLFSSEIKAVDLIKTIAQQWRLLSPEQKQVCMCFCVCKL